MHVISGEFILHSMLSNNIEDWLVVVFALICTEKDEIIALGNDVLM